MIKIIVTGALGHIGSAFIRHADVVDCVDELVIVDDLSTRRYASLFSLPERTTYRLVVGDVASKVDRYLLEDADCVIHLAGVVDPVSSARNPRALWENNLRGSRHIVEQCASAQVPLIFASSTSVYTPTTSIVDETSVELFPTSPYAQCKLREEALVLDHLGSGGSLIFRFGSIFGTSPGMGFQTAVSKFCFQAATRSPIDVWATALNQYRPYLDVRDAAGVLARAAMNGIFTGGILNAVTCNVTVGNILDSIRLNDLEPNIRLVESPIMNSLSFSVSSDEARKLGFSFDGDLDSAIRETLELLGSLG